jgi:bifunctional enzyme CysN/CysC
MPIVVVGHVDHGKSTVVGRLLADTGSLPDGKLEQVRELCRRTSKPFEYAFLLDALRDERDQGITIDAARVFFKSAARHYVVLDAPGHVEFLRNMVTGASRADAALLVVDAREGVRENSRRHATLLSMLGVDHVAVLVNKLDLLDWSESAFHAIAGEMREFLGRLGTTADAVVPISGLHGANLASRAAETPWYTGPTVLEVLDAFPERAPDAAAPFRMPVQDVYRFTRFGDDRRIVAGSIDSGRLAVGDEVVFHPSGKRSTVASIERFHAPAATIATAGDATGFTLDPQI